MNVSISNSDAQSCFLKSHNSMPIYTNHASILLNNGNRNYNCLEEQNGIEVGRTSPSGSSSDSRKSRYSTASLDSGRGSDGKVMRLY